MTTSNDPGPSRKRIATYGKAVRKGPSNHIAFKAMQDLETPSVTTKEVSVTSASAESITTDSSPSPSSIPHADFRIFDVPSSDDEAPRTLQKKRKIVHVTHPPETKSVKNAIDAGRTVLRHVSGKIAERGARTGGLIHEASLEYQRKQKAPPKPPGKAQYMLESSTMPALPIPEKQYSTTALKASTKGLDVRAGLVQNQLQQGSASPKYSAFSPINSVSSQTTRVQVGACTTPRKISLPGTTRKCPSRPSTPNGVDCEACEASLSLSASSILTPKGMKMWNELLGDDSDDDMKTKELEDSAENIQQGNGVHRNISRNQKPPRKRLIDSLVGQSKNRGSMLDSYSDQEEVAPTEPNLAPSLRVIEKQEIPPTQLVTIQTSLEGMNTLSKVATIGQSSQTLGAKVTYSRQRSMLAEQDLAKEMSFDIPLHESLPSVKLQKRRSSIPALAPLPSLHENAEAEDGKIGVAIQTIHELRQAGAESRLKDEVEDLLGRIGSPAHQNTARRSVLMELAKRMRDKLFCTNFISNGIDQRLFHDLGQEQDIVSGFILVSLLITVLDAGITPIIITQLRRQGIAQLLIRLINVDENILDVAKARKSNMSKLAQVALAEQHEAMIKLRVWGEIQPRSISPRTASLQCLELIVRQSRESGDTGDILSKEFVSNLFSILEGLHNKGVTSDAVDFQLALSTLVSHSLNPMTGLEEYLPIIRDILEVAMQNSSESCTILLLRLVLNATNNSPTASDAFASPELLRLMCHTVIEKFRLLSMFTFEDQRLVLVDHLVLTLIVMINIAGLSTRARQCFLAIEDSSLDNLVLIFQDNIEKAFEAESVEDSHLNVAGGYLAVLLGYLSLSPEIGERITLRQQTAFLLPLTLIACIDEFISHHKKVDDLLKEDGEHNPQAGLTDRLQALVDELKEMNVAK